MRYFRLSAILVIVLFVFTSCSWEKVAEEDRLVKEAKDEAEQIFDYLKEEDISSLSTLFSENQRKNYDLEKEWNNFFEQIDGKFLSYEDVSFEENRRTFADNKLTYLVVRIEFKNIKTDTGRIYEKMGYSKTLKSEYDSNNEGISGFSLRKERDKNDNLVMVYVCND